MEWDVDNITEEMNDNMFNALYTKLEGKPSDSDNPARITDVQKLDQCGLQRLANGTYFGADGFELFDFTLEDGINRGSVVLEISAAGYGSPLPELKYTIYRFVPKVLTELSLWKQAISTHVEEQGRKMSYDLLFSPASETRRHWDDYAERIGAKISSFTGTGEECYEWDRNRIKPGEPKPCTA